MMQRRSLPKISDMLEWGIVKAGDVIQARYREDTAILLANGNVETEDGNISMQQWLKKIYNWSSVQTYAFAVLKETGETLMDMRTKYMEEHDM